MPPSIWIILGPILLFGALAALLPLLVQTGRRPPDDGYSGIFYSNPDDPALLVPKRFGIGYTLNFGNPWSWAVLALIFLMVAVPLILSAVTIHHLPKQTGTPLAFPVVCRGDGSGASRVRRFARSPLHAYFRCRKIVRT